MLDGPVEEKNPKRQIIRVRVPAPEAGNLACAHALWIPVQAMVALSFSVAVEDLRQGVVGPRPYAYFRVQRLDVRTKGQKVIELGLWSAYELASEVPQVDPDGCAFLLATIPASAEPGRGKPYEYDEDKQRGHHKCYNLATWAHMLFPPVRWSSVGEDFARRLSHLPCLVRRAYDRARCADWPEIDVIAALRCLVASYPDVPYHAPPPLASGSGTVCAAPAPARATAFSCASNDTGDICAACDLHRAMQICRRKSGCAPGSNRGKACKKAS